MSFAPNGDLLWLEGRPSEKGRQVLVRLPAGAAAPAQVTPATRQRPQRATRVQEYGGGDYTLGPDSIVYFSNFADQRLYAQALPGGSGGDAPSPRALTAEGSKLRFADADVDAPRNRHVGSAAAAGMPAWLCRRAQRTAAVAAPALPPPHAQTAACCTHVV